MNKSKLKSIIRECVTEILSETTGETGETSVTDDLQNLLRYAETKKNQQLYQMVGELLDKVESAVGHINPNDAEMCDDAIRMLK